MFKELTDSLLTIVAVVAFIILAIYLLIQDTSLVGPI
jgi:preprotein translocase subunit SecE